MVFDFDRYFLVVVAAAAAAAVVVAEALLSWLQVLDSFLRVAAAAAVREPMLAKAATSIHRT